MTKKQPIDPLAGVSGDEAFTILRRLLTARPELADDIREFARNEAADVEREAVCQDVADALVGLDIDEVWARSGRTSAGYVDPGEVACELLLEAVDGELELLERLLVRGETTAAKALVLGVLDGVELVQRAGADPVIEEAGDGIEGIGHALLARWVRAGGGRDLLVALKREKPEWVAAAESVLRPRR